MRRTLLLTLALLAGCGLPGRDPSPALAPDTGIVVRPVDGDTAVIRIQGQEESVRFIGIDTPESVSDDVPVECFGPEAKARTAALLPAGTRVRLERDVEARDRYGRLLAYVRLEDGTLVNLLLVQEGYAAASAYPPNTAHQAELDAAQGAAKADGRGLWPACGGTNTPAASG